MSKAIATIRCLAADVVQRANSGHPGAPMGCAPMAHVLFSKFIQASPAHPSWVGVSFCRIRSSVSKEMTLGIRSPETALSSPTAMAVPSSTSSSTSSDTTSPWTTSRPSASSTPSPPAIQRPITASTASRSPLALSDRASQVPSVSPWPRPTWPPPLTVQAFR
jgi:hypothetical protein